MTCAILEAVFLDFWKANVDFIFSSQDMAAPEDGKIGSWRQTLDAEFLICHHLLSMGIANSCVVFCFCVLFHVLFVAKS